MSTAKHLPPFPKSYMAEMIRSDGDRTMLYVDGWMRRLDVYPKTGSPTIVISRPDRRVVWSLSPVTKTYSQAKLPAGLEHAFDPDSLYDWTEQGTEKIDKRICRRFVGIYREARGPIGDAREVCFVDSKTGMRRRVISYDVEGSEAVRVDYLKAIVGPPPSTAFEIPEGYKRGYPVRKRNSA